MIRLGAMWTSSEEMMNATVLVWAQFVLCVAVIAVAGARLVRHGDAIAAITGLSRNWVGVMLIATVTSLPELVTGLSAVTVAGAPDIAIGDALGSCIFNLAILAVVDLLHREGSVYARASTGHVLSAAFGIVLLATAGLAIVLSARGAMPSIGHVSLGSIGLLALYILTLRQIHRAEQSPARSDEPMGKRPRTALRRALAGYFAAAAIVLAAGVWLPLVGVQLAESMGWSQTLVGTLFIAFATSVPELATTLGAVRMGAVDLALGNLLGSNLFDLLIVALDDLAYLRGPIFAGIGPTHAASALVACMMSAAVIVALVSRPSGRVLRTVSWASVSLVALYVINAFVQFGGAG